MRRHSWLPFAFSYLLYSMAVHAEVVPLPNAHSHNDYLHAHPLTDALDNGFCSVEADIFLVEGQLLVAHDRKNVKPDRTLQSLYLDPLRKRAKMNGGRIYKDGPEVILLIDFKSDGPETYTALRKVLEEYADILTTFRAKSVEHKAVLAVLTGGRPVKPLEDETVRYAALDGLLPDLDTGPSKDLVPLVSSSWGASFTWRGVGPLPDDQRQKLADMVAKAKKHGYRLRFWAAPDRTEAWRTLRDAGVDLINTDNLAGLREFLQARR